MADRYGFQFTKALVPEVFILDGYVGAVEASGLLTGDTLPIWMSSIVRNSTGNYTVTLTDLWIGIPYVHVDVLSDNVSTDVTIVKVLSIKLGSVSGGATTLPTILLQVTSGGSAADPPPNGGLMFDIRAHNSNSL